MNKVPETSGRFLFEEKQGFPKWITILVISPIFLTIILTLALPADSTEDRREAWVALAIVIPLQLIMAWVFSKVKWEKIVTSNGLYYRWTFVQSRYRLLERHDISSIEIRQAPALQYGAGRVPGYGKSHNVSGGKGLQVYLSNGKKVFFGTDLPDQFHEAVAGMMGKSPRENLAFIHR